MSDAPVAPAVSSFDPAAWTKRINDLEDDKQTLQKQVFDLRAEVTRQADAAASARGAMKPMKEELDQLRAKLRASENLKELARLRTELSKIHTERAKRERELAEEDKKTKAKMDDLVTRAIRAEGKFQALESTAAILVKTRDQANASTEQLMAERDKANARLDEVTQELEALRAEYAKVVAEQRAAKTPAVPKTK